jgi:hypothetical protein
MGRVHAQQGAGRWGTGVTGLIHNERIKPAANLLNIAANGRWDRRAGCRGAFLASCPGWLRSLSAPRSGLRFFVCYILRHNTCLEHCAMTNPEWFAFVILPVVVGCLGVIGAWAGRRFIP